MPDDMKNGKDKTGDESISALHNSWQGETSPGWFFSQTDKKKDENECARQIRERWDAFPGRRICAKKQVDPNCETCPNNRQKQDQRVPCRANSPLDNMAQKLLYIRLAQKRKYDQCRQERGKWQ
jgi:hypothetical protein